MSNINPIQGNDPSSIFGAGGASPYSSTGGSGKPFQVGSGWGGFKDWLGEANYKKFKDNLCKTITEEIKRQKEKAHKAAKRLKAAETGEDEPID